MKYIVCIASAWYLTKPPAPRGKGLGERGCGSHCRQLRVLTGACRSCVKQSMTQSVSFAWRCDHRSHCLDGTTCDSAFPCSRDLKKKKVVHSPVINGVAGSTFMSDPHTTIMATIGMTTRHAFPFHPDKHVRCASLIAPQARRRPMGKPCQRHPWLLKSRLVVLLHVLPEESWGRACLQDGGVGDDWVSW